MNRQVLDQMLSLADSLEHFFLVTADTDGKPHLAVVQGRLEINDPFVSLSYWFCPQTVANLAVNRHVALVVWDSVQDNGFQLVGESEEFGESAILDGFTPIEEVLTLPQVFRTLTIRAVGIIHFTRKMHSDIGL